VEAGDNESADWQSLIASWRGEIDVEGKEEVGEGMRGNFRYVIARFVKKRGLEGSCDIAMLYHFSAPSKSPLLKHAFPLALKSSAFSASAVWESGPAIFLTPYCFPTTFRLLLPALPDGSRFRKLLVRRNYICDCYGRVVKSRFVKVSRKWSIECQRRCRCV